MSTSKAGKLYFTDDEKDLALSNNNALEYALSQGYSLKRTGSYYKMREHDSLVFSPDGKWSWNSRNIIKEDAISFIVKYEQKSYVEAICTLAGTLSYTPNPVLHSYVKNIANEKRELKMPERDSNVKSIQAYLCGTRAISPDIFNRLVSENKLYQSKGWQNVIMVGLDGDGNPKYVSQRSIDKPGVKAFKLDAKGSDKSYPFVIEGNNNTVVVCESPIEAMSYWSICQQLNSDLINCNIISLGGTSTNALDRFLQEHKNIDTIILATNHDKDIVRLINGKEVVINAGRSSRSAIKSKYGESYAIKTQVPKLNDWNDTIKQIKKGVLLQEKTDKPLNKQVLSK